MPAPRIPVAEKKLRGTFRRDRDAAQQQPGRIRLTVPVAPPAGLDAACRREWRTHMALCIATGTISHTDLRGFQTLVEAAALTGRAYRAAMKSGPVTRGAHGGKVVSAEWSSWTVAVGKYHALLTAFGLTPASGRMLPQLPVPAGSKPRAVV
jgi:hypothetical protein